MAAIDGMRPDIEVHAESALVQARARAAKIVVAWVLGTAVVGYMASTYPPLFGWPVVDYKVTGRVVSVHPVPDGEVVTWEATGPEGTIAWARHFDDSEWDVGDPIEGWVDEDDSFHMNVGAAWMGPSGFLFWFMSLTAIGFTARRVVGIVIARADVRETRDRPRPGYAALIDNPIPRAWRPLVLVWWDDPVASGEVAQPEFVLIADDDTGAHLMESGVTRIWEAAIDTGRFEWMKPRWIAVADGVVVPHRRALLAGALATLPLRDQRVHGPRKLERRPDDIPAPIVAPPERKNRFPWMLGWRALGLVALAFFSDLTEGGGDPVQLVGG